MLVYRVSIEAVRHLRHGGHVGGVADRTGRSRAATATGSRPHHGLSLWFSQTQRQLSQRLHACIKGPPARPGTTGAAACPRRTLPGTRSRRAVRAHQIALRDLLCVRLGFADQRRQALAKVSGRLLVKAVVDLAGIDQVLALAAAEIDAIPIAAVEGKACNGQRLALSAGLLDPVAASSRGVVAVADFGDDVLKPDFARVCKHLLAVDLNAFAELNIGAVDDLLQMRLALDQWQLSQVIAIEVEEVESDQDDGCRLPFSSF
jgi:hypothetical protein